MKKILIFSIIFVLGAPLFFDLGYNIHNLKKGYFVIPSIAIEKSKAFIDQQEYNNNY